MTSDNDSKIKSRLPLAWIRRNQKFLNQQRKSFATPKKAGYTAERRARDLNFRIKSNLRGRIRFALVGCVKPASSFALIGCSIDQFKQHIEALFKPGMTWQNYGKWHIDHIKPCALYDLTDEGQQRDCFHYLNLRPLWAAENYRKSSRFDPLNDLPQKLLPAKAWL